MSSLTTIEKRRLEKLFGMKTGYVLDFSNRTFEEFFRDVINVDIYAEKYDHGSGSKANRLRAYWTEESDDDVAVVLEAMVDIAEFDLDANPKLVEFAKKTIRRLRKGSRNEANRKVQVESSGKRNNSDAVSATVFPYDVALSFAGEQREYVEAVAEVLRDAGIQVFYDSFEDLWGKDLPVELEKVYRSGSRYIVVFVSREYVEKEWTNYERQHALAGRIERQDDSVLPAHFDDSTLPGLPSTVGYLHIVNMKPEELAERIIKKVCPKGA